MPELHKHFRKFLIVRTEGGQELYFRFYDPRVLRIFLPTCDAGQIIALFGPVDSFLMEDEDPAFALEFRHEHGILKQERLNVEDIAHQSVTPFTAQLAAVTPPANESAVRPALPGDQQVNPKPKVRWNLFD